MGQTSPSYSDALTALEHALHTAELNSLVADYLVEDMIGSEAEVSDIRLDEERRSILSHAVLQTVKTNREAVKAFQTFHTALIAEARR